MRPQLPELVAQPLSRHREHRRLQRFDVQLACDGRADVICAGGIIPDQILAAVFPSLVRIGAAREHAEVSNANIKRLLLDESNLEFFPLKAPVAQPDRATDF
jgi:hypothetical protein